MLSAILIMNMMMIMLMIILNMTMIMIFNWKPKQDSIHRQSANVVRQQGRVKSKQDLILAFHSKDCIPRISLKGFNCKDQTYDNEDDKNEDDDEDLDKNHEGSFLATTFSGSRSLSRNIPWVIFVK